MQLPIYDKVPVLSLKGAQATQYNVRNTYDNAPPPSKRIII